MKLSKSEWKVVELTAADLEQGRASDDVVRQFEPKFTGEAFEGAICGPTAMYLLYIEK